MELHTLILVAYQWTTLTSHVPTLCAPLGEKQSGKLSAYSPKLVKTDEIVRSLRSTSLTTVKFVHLLVLVVHKIF